MPLSISLSNILCDASKYPTYMRHRQLDPPHSDLHILPHNRLKLDNRRVLGQRVQHRVPLVQWEPRPVEALRQGREIRNGLIAAAGDLGHAAVGSGNDVRVALGVDGGCLGGGV